MLRREIASPQDIRLNLTPLNPDALINEKEVAALAGVATKTVTHWRWAGGGPPFVQINARNVKYRYGSVVAWTLSLQRQSSSDPGSEGVSEATG